MYNGIGLSTARGSGTSAYVQKNLSFLQQKKANSNYKQILQQFKENPAPPKKRANNEIIEHELKHKIEAEIYDYSQKLKANNLSEDELTKLIQIKRKELSDKILKNNNEQGE